MVKSWKMETMLSFFHARLQMMEQLQFVLAEP